MLGQSVERALDQFVVGDGRRPRAEPRQPRPALAVVRKQPMDIGADDAAVCGHRALGHTVGETRERPGAIGALGYPHMYLVCRLLLEKKKNTTRLPTSSSGICPGCSASAWRWSSGWWGSTRG